MAKKEAGFIKNNLDFFINSFKRIKITFFLILIIDFVFYFVSMQIGNFFIKILEKKAASVNVDQNLMALSQQAASSLLSSVKGFFIFLIFLIILFLMLMIINWSLFRGIIWSIAANKKFNFSFFKKFLLLNLIWLTIWFLIILLFALIIKSEVSVIYILIMAIIAFYFTNILYPLFLKENKIKMIKEAFKLGVKKAHYFIFPYMIIVSLFFIFSNAYNFIVAKISINPNLYLIAPLILAAWLRYYFIEIVDKIASKN